jgi:hypothetical protein
MPHATTKTKMEVIRKERCDINYTRKNDLSSRKQKSSIRHHDKTDTQRENAEKSFQVMPELGWKVGWQKIADYMGESDKRALAIPNKSSSS